MEVDNNRPALFEFFVYSIRSAYGAENHLMRRLPEFRSMASAQLLKAAIDQHLEVTEIQTSRLIRIFDLLDEKPAPVKSETMHGLMSDADRTIGNAARETVTCDLAINFTCQKIIAYEMIQYKTLSIQAKSLGYMDVANLLDKMFWEKQESADALNGMIEILSVEAV